MALQEENYNPVLVYKRRFTQRSDFTVFNLILTCRSAAGIADETEFKFLRQEFFLVVQTKFMSEMFIRYVELVISRIRYLIAFHCFQYISAQLNFFLYIAYQ